MSFRRLNPYQQTLALTTWRLALWLTNKFVQKYELLRHKEDLVGAASIALCRAAGTYDRNKCDDFGNYAARCVRNALYDCMRKEGRFKTSGKGINLPSREPDPSTTVELSDLLDVARLVLTQLQWEVLLLRHNEGYTLLETGNKLGMTKDKTWVQERRAKEKIRFALPQLYKLINQ